MPDTALVDELRDALGAQHVATDPDLTAAATTDWSRRWSGPAVAVVRPDSTDEVATVLRIAARHRSAVVPQGGNTGLVGGSVPRAVDPDGRPQLVLSTTRLTRLDPVDAAARSVVAGAGVTIATLQAHVRASGLLYAVDLASRDSATVGGTVSTNAGGLHVVAYGDTRRQVLAVEVVLADGSVVSRIDRPTSDATAYDLGQLVCGAEGTLGVVTAVRLRLVQPPQAPTTALYGLPDHASARALVAGARDLLAAEMLMADTLDVVLAATGLPAPLPRRWPVLVLLEVDGDRLPEPPVGPDGQPVDVAVDPRVWAYRERIPEAIATRGVGHKYDVAVPGERVDQLLAELPDVAAGSEVHVFGHLGVGNLHLNVVTPDPTDVTVDDRVLRLVARLGGSIAAEHGVGVAKTAWLGLTRSPAEIAAMRAVKAALDPESSLNPGVLLG